MGEILWLASRTPHFGTLSPGFAIFFQCLVISSSFQCLAIVGVFDVSRETLASSMGGRLEDPGN